MKTSTQKTRAPLAVLAASFALAACSPTVTGWTDAENAKTIDVQRLEASIAVSAAGAALTGTDAANVDRFLASQGNLSNLRVTLNPRSEAGRASMAAVADHLISRGVRARHISRSDEVNAGAGDVLVVAEHYVASAPNCPDWTHANIMDGANQNSSNFGCASQSGLARMVADPRDLVVGRSFDGVGGNRAAYAVDRYNRDDIKELPIEIYTVTTGE